MSWGFTMSSSICMLTILRYISPLNRLLIHQRWPKSWWKLVYVTLMFVTYIFNMLKMNRDKTELLVLNGRQRPLPSLTTISVCDEEINQSTKARNVGVIYDSSMSMENHIMAICKAAFFHLRNISRIRKYLSTLHFSSLVSWRQGGA